MNKNQLTSKLFTVRCEHQQGMLSFILTFFERPGYEVLSVSQAPTDINGIILIMVEVAIPARKAEEFVPKIESIDGVIDIVISYGSFVRAGFFRLSTSRLTAGFWDLVGRNRAVVIHRSGGSILLEKHGKADELDHFHQMLEEEGVTVMGACQLPLPINDQGLIGIM